jgi:hypothetical protein
MTAFAADGGQKDLSASGRPVYRDPHETSLTLMVLGAVITVSVAAQLDWPGLGAAGSGFGWALGWAHGSLTDSLLVIAFLVLWLMFWRKAASRGVRRPRGFGTAAIISLAAILPPFVLAAFYAGPFLSFGIGLAVASLMLRNRVLTYWALGIGSVGVFEGFFGITNRLPTAVWAAWEHPAIYLLLGALTCLAGVVIGVRERRAVQ